MTINILICLFIIFIIIIIFLSFNDKIEPLETDKKNYNNYNNSGDDVSLDVDETEPSETPNEFIDKPKDTTDIENKPTNVLSGLQEQIDSNIESTISEEDILEYKKKCSNTNTNPNLILGYDPGMAYMIYRKNNYFDTSTKIPQDKKDLPNIPIDPFIPGYNPSPPPATIFFKYNCNNGECSPDLNGKYISLEQCKSQCKLSPPKPAPVPTPPPPPPPPAPTYCGMSCNNSNDCPFGCNDCNKGICKNSTSVSCDYYTCLKGNVNNPKGLCPTGPNSCNPTDCCMPEPKPPPPKPSPVDEFCNKSNIEQWTTCNSMGINPSICNKNKNCVIATEHASGWGGLGDNKYPGCMVKCNSCSRTRITDKKTFMPCNQYGTQTECNNHWNLPANGNNKLCTWVKDKCTDGERIINDNVDVFCAIEKKGKWTSGD